jgi:aryl-alcohol dehydrogenase-like predicted oxidoreductase
MLTGKYRPEHRFPADDERSHLARFQGQSFADYLAVTAELGEIAREKGISLVQLALAWVLRLPSVSCVIVGAKNPGQLREHLGAIGVVLTDEDQARIDSILVNVSRAQMVKKLIDKLAKE